MKFKNKLLALGTVAAIAAPVASVVACGTDASHNKNVFTEYVRAHDIVLSLGVSPAFHARSDIGSTHDIDNEGYLDEFALKDSKGVDKTINARRYNGGDREYFSSLSIGAYVARNITDSDGKFTDVREKVSIQNSDTTDWQSQTELVANKFDSLYSGHNFIKRAKDIEAKFKVREDQLEKDSDAYLKTNTKPINVLVVKGTDTGTGDEGMFSGAVGQAQMKQLYNLSAITLPKGDASKLNENYVEGSSGTISGRTKATANVDFSAAFAGKVDKILYLKTPKSTFTDANIQNNQLLKDMLASGGTIEMSSYDDFYLPFRGAGIGANVSIDNIEKDFFGKTVSADWKDIYKTEDLITSSQL